MKYYLGLNPMQNVTNQQAYSFLLEIYRLGEWLHIDWRMEADSAIACNFQLL